MAPMTTFPEAIEQAKLDQFIAEYKDKAGDPAEIAEHVPATNGACSWKPAEPDQARDSQRDNGRERQQAEETP